MIEMRQLKFYFTVSLYLMFGLRGVAISRSGLVKRETYTTEIIYFHWPKRCGH
jgi:hypothetical protein